MTVGDLVTLLASLPQDATVKFLGGEYQHDERDARQVEYRHSPSRAWEGNSVLIS